MDKVQKNRLIAEILSTSPIKRDPLYGLFVKLLLEFSDNSKFKTIHSYMDKLNEQKAAR